MMAMNSKGMSRANNQGGNFGAKGKDRSTAGFPNKFSGMAQQRGTPFGGARSAPRGGKGGGQSGTATVERLQSQLASTAWAYYEDMLDLNVPQSQVVAQRVQVERLRGEILDYYGLGSGDYRRKASGVIGGSAFAGSQVDVGGDPSFGPMPQRKRRRTVASDPATDPSSCAKTRLGHVAQLFLGRTVKKGDVQYETQEHGEGEDVFYSCSVNIPEYDQSLHTGEMCKTAKEAEVSAAEAMLADLQPVWMPLEEERKAKRQAKLMEES